MNSLPGLTETSGNLKMFKLNVYFQSEEVKLQMEFGPPPLFKTIDDATDWALTHLPLGATIEITDGRKTLRAQGYVGGKLQYVRKNRKL